MVEVNPGHLMGLAAIITAIGGIYAAIHSRRDTNRIQAAANELTRREQAAAEKEREQEYYRGVAEHQRTQMEKMRADHARAITEKARACEQTRAGLTDVIRTLQSVVTNEIATAAADDVVAEGETHARAHLQDLDDDGSLSV